MAMHYRAAGTQRAACGDATAKMFTTNKATVTCVACRNKIGTGGSGTEPYPRTN